MPLVDVMVPGGRKMDPETAISMLHVLLRGALDGVLRSIRLRKWQYIDQARNDLVRECLADPGATHMLLLDDDMTWEPDLIPRLLAHNQPVVGALYFIRSPPHVTACGHWRDREDMRAVPLDHLPGGLEQVDYLGLGAGMVRTDVFREMTRHFGDENWFRSQESGEDIHFCRRLTQMGVPVFVDGSLICGHITEQLVTEEHWKHFHGGVQ